MLPARAPQSQPISGVFPISDGVIAIADDCRDAALAFVNDLPRSKYELAHWLRGPYARATRFKTSEMHAEYEPTHGASVDERDLETLLRSARLTVMAALEKAALARSSHSPHDPLPFVDVMVSAHYVVPAAIGHSRGWLPVDEPRIRLRSRVLALLAADALVRPHDYADSLFVCHRCERVVFDERAVARGYCSAHTSSGGA